MGIEELYDRMSALLDMAIEMCGDDSIGTPYGAIDALTDLMEEEGYNTEVSDLIDEIINTMEDIDSMESQGYSENDEDRLFEDDEEVSVDDSMSKEEVNKRRQRFLTYGVKKVNEAITSINKLQRLAEKSNYIVTPEEKKKIVNLLKSAVKQLEDIYNGEKQTPNFFSISESNLDRIVKKIVRESKLR